MKGEDWVGVRVRAETHRALSKNERIRYSVGNATINKALCFGTITKYCPSSNECFVVFDVPGLQPQWVTCVKGQVEILVGASEYSSANALLTNSETSSSSEKADSNKTSDIIEEKTKDELNLSTEDSTMQVPSEDDIEKMKPCELCHLECRFSDAIFSCSVCNLSCHSHCIPPNGLRPLNEQSKAKTPSKCWNCTVCYSCNVNAWNAPLIYWNVKRVESTAVDKHILLCGACLHRYKHFQEFCTICYKLYSDSPRLMAIADESQQQENEGEESSSSQNAHHSSKSGLHESLHGKQKALDDQSMVSCLLYLFQK